VRDAERAGKRRPTIIVTGLPGDTVWSSWAEVYPSISARSRGTHEAAPRTSHTHQRCPRHRDSPAWIKGSLSSMRDFESGAFTVNSNQVLAKRWRCTPLLAY
jgi:hypothetical protein